MARAAYDPLDPYAQDDTGEDPYATTNEDARQSLLDNMAGDLGGDTRIGITDPGQGPQKTADGVAAPETMAVDQIPQAATASASPAATADPLGWIDAELLNAESTDDPGYWREHIGNDPKVRAGDQSAIEYWKDRIRRGNGSKYIRNGSMQLFQDTPGATPNAGNNWTAAPQVGPAIGSGSGAISNNSTYQNPMIPYITQMLQSLIGRDQSPIDTNAPEVNPALTAYKGNRANALAEQRNALAERAAAPGGSGTNSGAFDAATNAAQEKAGQDTATFGGNLIYNANQQRQQQLQSLLALATSLGLGDQAQQIQDEMNKLNLGYNYTALDANLNQNALLAALHG